MPRRGRGGTSTEYLFCKYLLKRGYKVAQRTAGSNSPLDVVAITQSNKYEGYQVKRALFHKYVTDRLSEARKETEGLPIPIRIWCVEHKTWYPF